MNEDAVQAVWSRRGQHIDLTIEDPPTIEWFHAADDAGGDEDGEGAWSSVEDDVVAILARIFP